MKSLKIFISILICTVFLGVVFYNSYQISLLNQRVTQINSSVAQINIMKTDKILNEKISLINSDIERINADLEKTDAEIEQIKADIAQIADLKKEIEQNSKIYVYNMDDVLTQIGLVESKKKFEEDINKLSEEVAIAEEKIKNIKNAKVEDDFATVYLDSLKLKRNDLINNYQKQLEEYTDKINKALKEVAAEKNVSAIFKKSSFAVVTGDAEDVSEEIVKKIKK